jgi:hypothetical protein
LYQKVEVRVQVGPDDFCEELEGVQASLKNPLLS